MKNMRRWWNGFRMLQRLPSNSEQRSVWAVHHYRPTENLTVQTICVAAVCLLRSDNDMATDGTKCHSARVSGQDQRIRNIRRQLSQQEPYSNTCCPEHCHCLQANCTQAVSDDTSQRLRSNTVHCREPRSNAYLVSKCNAPVRFLVVSCRSLYSTVLPLL